MPDNPETLDPRPWRCEACSDRFKNPSSQHHEIVFAPRPMFAQKRSQYGLEEFPETS